MTTRNEPLPALLHSLATATAAVANVNAEQFNQPTPCAEFNVGQLIGHLMAVLGRIEVIGKLGDPDNEPRMIDVEPGAALKEWFVRAGAVVSTWSDPSLLGTMVKVPWGTVPGAAALGAYVSELTTHTWDLAKATGLSIAFHDDVVALALRAMRMALPDDRPRTPDIPFGNPVPVPADAPLIDQLVAFTGRQP